MNTCVRDAGWGEAFGNFRYKKGGGGSCIGIFVYYFYYISPLLISFSLFYLSLYALSTFFLLYRLLGCLGSFCVGIVCWFVGKRLCGMGDFSLFHLFPLSFTLLLLFSFTLLYTSN